MCTLTYIPNKKGGIITSTRDEMVSRESDLPQEHLVNGKKIYFSKDKEKGGTWLAYGNKLAVCLLNGADKTVDFKEHYSESRGKIVLNRFSYTDNFSFFNSLNLDDFAPFTLVIFDFLKNKKLEEIIWDGKEKKLKKINETTPKIWSSSTLYSSDVKQKREHWFTKFLEKNHPLCSINAVDFHLHQHTEISEENILMRRNDGKQTTSISQIEISENETKYYYKDILTNKEVKKQWKEMDLQLL